MGTQTDRQTDRDQQTGRQSRRRESCSTGSQHCGWCLSVCLFACLPVCISLCVAVSLPTLLLLLTLLLCAGMTNDERGTRTNDGAVYPFMKFRRTPPKKCTLPLPLSPHTHSATHSSSQPLIHPVTPLSCTAPVYSHAQGAHCISRGFLQKSREQWTAGWACWVVLAALVGAVE